MSNNQPIERPIDSFIIPSEMGFSKKRDPKPFRESIYRFVSRGEEPYEDYQRLDVIDVVVPTISDYIEVLNTVSKCLETGSLIQYKFPRYEQVTINKFFMLKNEGGWYYDAPQERFIEFIEAACRYLNHCIKKEKKDDQTVTDTTNRSRMTNLTANVVYLSKHL